MNIFEIENKLPNGFHDADLHSLKIDYENQQLEIELEIWTSTNREDEKYDRLIIVLEHFELLYIGPSLRVITEGAPTVSIIPYDKIREEVTLPKEIASDACFVGISDMNSGSITVFTGKDYSVKHTTYKGLKD